MFLRTSSLKRLNSIGAAENIPCCVQKNTSLKFHFVVCKQRDYHNIGKQYDGLSSLWAIRMYSPHVCLQYSRQICRPTSLCYISNCVFLFLCAQRNSVPAVKNQSRLCIARSFAVSLREGFSSQMQKTDSGTIHALPSVWIFSFPSVSHLLYGYFMCADLKDASFFGLILSMYERKIVPKTA